MKQNKKPIEKGTEKNDNLKNNNMKDKLEDILADMQMQVDWHEEFNVDMDSADKMYNTGVLITANEAKEILEVFYPAWQKFPDKCPQNNYHYWVHVNRHPVVMVALFKEDIFVDEYGDEITDFVLHFKEYYEPNPPKT